MNLELYSPNPFNEIRKLDAENHKLESKNRQLKRALWLARAERAKILFKHFFTCMKAGMYGISTDCFGEFDTIRQNRKAPYQWMKIWADVERKCRAMADKFKEKHEDSQLEHDRSDRESAPSDTQPR